MSAPPVVGIRRHREHVGLASVVLGAAVVMVLSRRAGHWWGDDWALYVRQAESIFTGGVRDVVADNRFTVEMSGRPEFSPPVYPWGFPLLLAPFVAVFGTDLDRLGLVGIASACWFLVMWHRLARPRLGGAAALAGTAALALSPAYLRWSEQVQSELPFMAVAFTALVVLDHQRTRGSLLPEGTSLAPLVAVGLAGAAAFSVRREGLATLVAIGIAQLTAIGVWWGASKPGDRRWLPVAGRMAVPLVASVSTVAALELTLPSTLVPSYGNTGVHNVFVLASDHIGHVAETIGLKSAGSDTPTLFGDTAAGTLAVATFLVATGAGVLWAAWRRPHSDLPLVAFLLAAVAVGGSPGYSSSRYLATVGPVALILAASALRAVARRLGGSLRADVAVASILALLAIANAVRAADLVEDSDDFRRAGRIEWGPDAPESIEMFDAVAELTGTEDVIGFFKARAMTLRTTRRTLHVDRSHPIERVDHLLTHIVVEHGDPSIGTVTTDQVDGDPIWSNTRFTLFRLPSRD